MHLAIRILSFLVAPLCNEVGALTFTVVKRFKPQSGIRRGVIDITLDAAYGAGGWAITGANLGIKGQGTISLLIPPGSKNGYPLEWNQVAGKLKAYQESDTVGAMKEIDAGDLSAAVIRCEYIGY